MCSSTGSSANPPPRVARLRYDCRHLRSRHPSNTRGRPSASLRVLPNLSSSPCLPRRIYVAAVAQGSARSLVPTRPLDRNTAPASAPLKGPPTSMPRTQRFYPLRPLQTRLIQPHQPVAHPLCGTPSTCLARTSTLRPLSAPRLMTMRRLQHFRTYPSDPAPPSSPQRQPSRPPAVSFSRIGAPAPPLPAPSRCSTVVRTAPKQSALPLTRAARASVTPSRDLPLRCPGESAHSYSTARTPPAPDHHKVRPHPSAQTLRLVTDPPVRHRWSTPLVHSTSSASSDPHVLHPPPSGVSSRQY